MRVLVAPDKFRGTLSAPQAARAIATGWRRIRPQDDVVEVPMADGGEGTLDAVVAALGGDRVRARVQGPLGDPVDAEIGLVDTPGGRRAVVESAQASGPTLVPDGRRRATAASTFGTGQLILAALDAAAASILVTVGGSATTDGGAGMAEALGARLRRADGRGIDPGGRGLLDLARIDVTALDPRVARTTFVVATDVDNPLTGVHGAAHVYAPQKGASREDVLLLDRALGHLAAVVHRDLGVDLRDVPGAGAAGGLGFGLMAFCGARRRPGVDVVMEAVGLVERAEGVDVLVTGEGKLDEQSVAGKVPAGIIRLGRAARIPVAIVCGDAEVHPPGVEVVSLVERVGRERALGDARSALEDAAADLAGRADALPSPG